MLGAEIQKLVSRFNRQKRKVLSQHWIDEFYSLGVCPSRTQVPFGLFGQGIPSRCRVCLRRPAAYSIDPGRAGMRHRVTSTFGRASKSDVRRPHTLNKRPSQLPLEVSDHVMAPGRDTGQNERLSINKTIDLLSSNVLLARFIPHLRSRTGISGYHQHITTATLTSPSTSQTTHLNPYPVPFLTDLDPQATP